MQALFTVGRGPGARPHFHLFGIPVRIELSFFLLAIIIGSSGPPSELPIIVACLIPSVLWHELGHAVVYRAFGAKCQIVLTGWGGLTFGAREKPFSTWERVVVSAAGPFAGLGLGALVYLLHRRFAPYASPALRFTDEIMLWMNFGWSLFNLLPIVPLDGGHILEAVLMRGNALRGRIWARYVAVLGSVILGVVAFQWLHDSWMLFIMAIIAFQAFQGIVLLRQAASRPVAISSPQELPEVQENLERLQSLMKEERSREAKAVANQVLDAAKLATTRDAALHALAWIAISDGDPKEALQVLGRTSRQFDDPFLWGTAIAASGDAAHALPHLSRAYASRPEPQVVMAYARVLEALGRRDDAMALAGEEAPAERQRALAEALFRSRDFEFAAQVSERLFAKEGSAEDAYNAACARARRGDVDAALDLLQRATLAGFHDGAHLATDPDLAALRERPEFRDLVSQLTAPPAPAG